MENNQNNEAFCPFCGRKKESQYIAIIHRNVFKMCECERSAMAKKEKEELSNGRKALFKRLQLCCNIRGKPAQYSFNNYTTEGYTGLDEIKKACIEYTGNPTKNLILCGGVGVGKTHLMSATANRIILNRVYACSKEGIADHVKQGILPQKPPLYYIREIDLCDLAFRLNDYAMRDDADDTLNICCERGLLCIDDLGIKTTYNERERALMYNIIDHRYINGLPTIITTNLTPNEIKGLLGIRSYDRLTEDCITLKIEGKSRRNSTHRSPSC